MNNLAERVGATLHTTRLLTQLQLRLVFNRILVGGRAGGSGRQASYGKAKAGPWGFIGSALLTLGGMLHLRQVVDNAVDNLNDVMCPAMMTAVLTLMLILLITFTDWSQRWGEVESDLPWLFTLPVGLKTLLFGRLVDRTCANLFAWVGFGIFLVCLAWRGGWGMLAPIVGLGLTVWLVTIASAIRLLIDTGARLLLSPSGARTLQGICTLLSMTTFIGVQIAGVPNASWAQWAHAIPPWLLRLPTGIAVQAALSPTPTLYGAASILLGEYTLLIVAVCLGVLHHALRFGPLIGGDRASGRAARRGLSMPWRHYLGPLAWRDILWMTRDRAQLVTTCMPAIGGILTILVSFGLLPQPQPHANLPMDLLIPFMLHAQQLQTPLLRIVLSEGSVLWLVMTTPIEVVTIIRRRASLSVGLALASFGVCMVVLHIFRHVPVDLTRELLLLGCLILCGMIASAASVLAVASAEYGVAPSPGGVTAYVYLYMLAAGTLGVTISLASRWAAAAAILVVSALAVALWQKAAARLPYLLDPDAVPPRVVTGTDGLLAALFFLALRGMLLLFLPKALTGDVRASVSYTAAALLLCCGYQVYAMMVGMQGMPRFYGAPTLRQASVGLLIGCGAALAGVECTWALLHAPAWLLAATDLTVDAKYLRIASIGSAWMGAVALVAAPLCEEFVFRGLLFTGLQRTLPLWSAMVLSAAIFALIHPAILAVPFFLLGAGCAWAYRRTNSLITPVLVHAVFNAAMLLVYQAV